MIREVLERPLQVVLRVQVVLRLVQVVMLAQAILLAGCDVGVGTAPGAVIADSAGVRVVSNEAQSWSTDQGWQVRETPRLQIGRVDGDAAYLFDRVRGAVTLSDGTIAVADGGSSSIRYFDRTGRHLSSIGGAGEGPEEFRHVVALHGLPGDSLAVIDRYERIQVIEPGGVFGESTSLGTTGFAIDPVTYRLNPVMDAEVVGFLRDGTMLARHGSRLTLSPTREFEEPEHQELRFVRYALGTREIEELNDVAQAAGPEFVPHPMNLTLRAVFGPETLSAAGGRFLALGFPDRRELQWYDAEGGLEVVARLPWAAQPVTAAMIEEYRGHPAQPLSEDIMAGQTFAEELPGFSDLRVDAAGNVWLRRYEPAHAVPVAHYLPTFDGPSTWSVIGPDGRWLGDVRIPPSLHVIEIGEDHILGLHRDAFDVEYIRVHDLQKP